MAHVEHYKMSDVRRLANEWTRDEAYHCTDGRIDPARTPNNYVIDDSYKYGMKLKRSGTFSAAVRARLQEVQHSNRKDLNVLSDWVITCPQELLGDDTKIKRFFEVAYEFTADRYGKENVLQGFVHMDETTPHMHMPLMPVKDGRVSSKALFTRTELSSYHKALEKVMEDEFGMHGLVLNGRTKGNYTVKEMKQRARDEEENARLRAQNAAEQARLAEAVQRRMAAEKAAEAALTARDEARKEVSWLRNEARQIVNNVPEQLGTDDQRVVAALKSIRNENGDRLYDRVLVRYHKDGGKNIPRISEDIAKRKVERMRQAIILGPGMTKQYPSDDYDY